MPRTPMTPRQISSQEADVLRRALSVCPVVAVSEALRDCVADLEVISRCECGCDTVEFRGIDWVSPPSVLADGVAETPDRKAIGLIVFGTQDRVTCLEVYSYDEVPAHLPTLSSIRSYGLRDQDAAV